MLQQVVMFRMCPQKTMAVDGEYLIFNDSVVWQMTTLTIGSESNVLNLASIQNERSCFSTGIRTQLCHYLLNELHISNI